MCDENACLIIYSYGACNTRGGTPEEADESADLIVGVSADVKRGPYHTPRGSCDCYFFGESDVVKKSAMAV